VFSGQDFTSISQITFEDAPLSIVAKDKKSISVLLTTKVTAAEGNKTLVATPTTGKPTMLSIYVEGR
jgi:hypothetical protein